MFSNGSATKEMVWHIPAFDIAVNGPVLLNDFYRRNKHLVFLANSSFCFDTVKQRNITMAMIKVFFLDFAL
jgi:hypothetical protein